MGFCGSRSIYVFQTGKTMGQALIWVLCLMLMITVYRYALFINFYLTDKYGLIIDSINIDLINNAQVAQVHWEY